MVNYQLENSHPPRSVELTRITKPNGRLGVTAVEFAVVANVLFMFIFGAIEFSRLHMIRNLAQDAAYFAARDCIVPGATEVEATAYAQEILGYLDVQGANIIINNGNGINENSNEVTVQVTVPIAENAIFIPWSSDEFDIVANATMRTERYDGYYEAGG